MNGRENKTLVTFPVWTIVNDAGEVQLLAFGSNAFAFALFLEEDLASRFTSHMDQSTYPRPFAINAPDRLLMVLNLVKSQNGCTHVAFDPIFARQSTTEVPVIDSVIADIKAAVG